MLNDQAGHGLGMLPMVKAPESVMLPGMSAPARRPASGPARALGEVWTERGAVMRQGPDGPVVAVPDPPTPNYWNYDFNPASGSARATYTGETALIGSATLNGSPLINAAGAVSSFNTRTGAVTLLQADVTAVAVGSFNTRTGAVTMTLADVVASLLPAAIPNYLSGCILSTAGGSQTMSIAAGSCCNSTNVDFMTLAAINKTTNAWAVGSGSGGLDTGAIANNTWYKFYVIKRPDTQVVDVAFTVNALATGPTFGGNIPAAYTEFRYIGSGKTNGAAQWIAFKQDGDWFMWSTPVNDVATGTTPGASSTRTLASVPNGVRTQAWVEVAIQDVGATVVASDSYVFDLALANVGPSNTTGGTQRAFVGGATSNNWQFAVHTLAFTNTAQQVGLNINGGGSSNVSAWINTMGWVDTRGK